MAKRVRSSAKTPRRSRPVRPAGERPTRDLTPPAHPTSPATGPEPEILEDEVLTGSSGHLTEDQLRRAEELEAEIAARERAAIAETIRRRNRTRGHDPAAGVDLNAPLSVRAAHEYAYVARDVRRIVLTGGLTIAILAVLHVLVNVMGVFAL